MYIICVIISTLHVFKENPPKPSDLKQRFLSDPYVRLQWSPVKFAMHYLISLQSDGSTYKIIETNDTSVTIDYLEGMNVGVQSVNNCHMESSKSTLTPKKADASKYA